ncbi:MAG: hypothetical protein J7604_11445 [Sporocytophaga sp.]|uniref:hypothetical protein n=1 Tax=Sporocytophaga sp. TaxID=2231183 RepID=UPI001B25944F|nr:hypothetical protein [Sporocytophaga sp.]MBO9700815.1 hypothetical protein [Sporocytophaga sp.]
MKNIELYKVNYLLKVGDISMAFDLFKSTLSLKIGIDKKSLFLCDVDDLKKCNSLPTLFGRLSNRNYRLIAFSSVFSNTVLSVPSSDIFNWIYSHDFYERTVIDIYGLQEAFNKPEEDYVQILDAIKSLCNMGFINPNYTPHQNSTINGQLIINETSIDEFYFGNWPKSFAEELVSTVSNCYSQLPKNIWNQRGQEYVELNLLLFFYTFFAPELVSKDYLFDLLNLLREANNNFKKSILNSLKISLDKFSTDEINELVLYAGCIKVSDGKSFIQELIDYLEKKRENLGGFSFI